MMQGLLGLFLTLAFTVFLLAGIAIHTRWSTGAKTAIVLASAAAVTACYYSLIGLLGWPTPFGTEGRDLVLIHAYVEEPDRSVPSEGGIYLWVRSGEAGDPPRALGFPYRRHLHELVVEAMRKSSGGARQGVRLTGKAGGGGPNESFNVFDLQRPELTDKDHHSVGETNQMKE